MEKRQRDACRNGEPEKEIDKTSAAKHANIESARD